MDTSKWITEFVEYNINNKEDRKGIPISMLTIPGTHDSGSAFFSKAVKLLYFPYSISKCQNCSIEDQFEFGVRYFDIRIKIEEREAYVVHDGPCVECLGGKVAIDIDCYSDEKSEKRLTLDMVMDSLGKLIKMGEYEFAIVNIKLSKSSMGNEDVLVEILEKYQDLFYTPLTNIPKIKDVANKILLLSRVDISNRSDIGYVNVSKWECIDGIGIASVPGFNVYIQDKYMISNEQISIKLKWIMETMNYAEKHTDQLVLNHASCTNILEPYLLAQCINSVIVPLAERMSNGVIIMDFVDRPLVSKVVESNFKRTYMISDMVYQGFRREF